MAGAEEPVGRRVQLPQFADGLALPAADVGQGTGLGHFEPQALVDGPMADLPAVHVVPESASEFAGGESVGVAFGAGRRNQGASKERLFFGRPFSLVVPPRTARKPCRFLPRGAGGQVGSPQVVEAGLPDLEGLHGLFPGKAAFDKRFHRVANVGDTQPIGYLRFHRPQTVARIPVLNSTPARPP